MLIGRDLGRAGMMTFEEQAVRRDDAVEVRQRCDAERFSVGGARLSALEA
jgi:hypothetical protein